MASEERACGPRSAAAAAAAARGPGGWGSTARAHSSPRSVSETHELCLDRIAIKFQRQLKISGLVTRKRDGVLACIARRAIRSTPRPDRGEQPFQAEVANAVGIDIFPNLLQRMGGRNQLGATRRVDTVEAGRDRGRAT